MNILPDAEPRAVHFVGPFECERKYWSAVSVWGRPGFIHPGWDRRAAREVMPGDVVVHMQGEWTAAPAERSFSDTLECARLEQLAPLALAAWERAALGAAGR